MGGPAFAIAMFLGGEGRDCLGPISTSKSSTLSMQSSMALSVWSAQDSLATGVSIDTESTDEAASSIELKLSATCGASEREMMVEAASLAFPWGWPVPASA